MSLAYGVDGEIQLELENNYGDWSDWSKMELMLNIDKTLKNILTFADDPKEKAKVRRILKSQSAKLKIAKEFFEEHKEYLKNIKW